MKMDIGVATEMLNVLFFFLNIETTNTYLFVLKLKPSRHTNKHVLYMYILNSNLIVYF